MFFDIGAGEILGLAILGVILVGPERLPHVASRLQNGQEITSTFTNCYN